MSKKNECRNCVVRGGNYVALAVKLNFTSKDIKSGLYKNKEVCGKCRECDCSKVERTKLPGLGPNFRVTNKHEIVYCLRCGKLQKE